MLRVILADDEVHIRNLLKYLVHWDELGLEFAGDYDNGCDVLRAMKEMPADIIITDIEMPEMDGLGMIQELHSIAPDCRYIIISGYRDFEYARAAVKLGVSDYILKPIDEEELNAALAGLVQSLGKRQVGIGSSIRKKLVSAVLGQQILRSVEEVNREYDCHFTPTGRFMVLWMSICRAERDNSVSELAERVMSVLKRRLTPLCTDLEHFMLTRQSYAMLVQIEQEDMPEFIRMVDEAYGELTRRERRSGGERFYFSVGRAVDSIEEIKSSMESARFFINGRLTYGESRVYFADNMRLADVWQKENRTLPPESIREIERDMERMDELRFRETVRKLFDAYRGEKNATLYIHLCRSICEVIALKLGQLGVNGSEVRTFLEETDIQLDNCDTIDMLRETVEGLGLSAIRTYLAGRRQNPHSYVQLAKDYIDSHYAENITLNLIADQAHINPAYLSALFKEETGVNYIDYLTSLRMEKAKALLTDASLNLSQIAEMVGYNSARYFSKIFETQMGIKPSEYRRLHLRRDRR